ncbi:hypothetical protein Tco_1239542, partial [Tanacetum coccineum]
LHALVDGNKVTISEASVRRDLKLEDEEGVDCLPNSAIFKQLTLMGSKTTAWNEFSSTMASEIICLATNQKFNFSKYIFESMVKNLDNVSGNFLMYSRFMQVFLEQQLDDMSTHKRIYIAPSHTKKIFGNMKRVGKDEDVHKELGDSLVRAATTASSLEAEQDSGGGLRCQETIGDTIAQTRFKNVSKHSNDSLLARGNTLLSDEDSLKLKKLMELCANLQQRVLDLEKTMTTQQNEIASLKRSSSRRVESSEKGRKIDDLDADIDVILVNDAMNDEDIFGVNDLKGDEVIIETEVAHEVVVETEVASKDVNLSVDEVTLAQALATLKSAKPKADKVMIQEPEQGTITTTTTTTTVTAASTRPKAKGLVIHEEEQATTPTVSSQQPSQIKV